VALIGTRRDWFKPDTSLGGRLRLLVAIALLAVPLVAAVWAFAALAGRNAKDHADAQLATYGRLALDEYSSRLDAAQSKAAVAAARRDVQVALARGNAGSLRRLAAEAGVAFRLAGGRRVGAIPARAGLRSVEVVVRGRTVGRVLAGVALDPRFARELAASIHLPATDRLLFRNGRVRRSASTLLLGGVAYRSVGAKVASGVRPTALLVLTPASRVDASAAHARNRVLLAGLVTLGALALLVYMLAPVIARGRLERQQRDQAARVLLHLGEGVLLVDDDGVVRLWNQTAERITGLSADAVVGRAAADALADWPSIERQVGVGGGAPATPIAVEIGPRQFWLSISAVSYHEGTVYAFRDLTEERRLEQMRSDFVATVSHELRTPLAAIHGAAMTLTSRGSKLEPGLRERLFEIVADQSERLSELVEQILLAAQLDSGGLRFVVQSFDAAELARAVIDSIQLRFPAGVSVELAGPQSVLAVGDPGKTRRILSNLIDNAVKYSPDGGRIGVRLTRWQDRMRFTVSDQGLGIPPAEQERIFEKFYRLDAAMSRGVGGSGLGLYICRELAEGMNGRIWVSSTPDRGSDFCLELPAAESQAATA
jgi:signal transduction histidine kinase